MNSVAKRHQSRFKVFDFSSSMSFINGIGCLFECVDLTVGIRDGLGVGIGVLIGGDLSLIIGLGVRIGVILGVGVCLRLR
jgi:hypothetical protein